jgi:hypothetical protein
MVIFFSMAITIQNDETVFHAIKNSMKNHPDKNQEEER